MYGDGNGVDQNYSEAIKWYRMAADQGDARAQKNLGIMYYKGQGVDQSNNNALRWLYKSAKQGNEDAKSAINKIIADKKAEKTN